MRNNAVKTLYSGEIVDQYMWNVFCTILKISSQPDDAFRIMTQCCDMCQKDIGHNKEEHESCCGECNKNKNESDDVIPFVMKEYYHAHKRYYDDDVDIWFAQDTPVIFTYEKVDVRSIKEDNLYEFYRNTCADCNCLIPPDSLQNNMKYVV